MNDYSYEDIEIGHKESFTVTVSEKDQDAFRDITGDVNPLHMDSEYAKEKGYKGRVVFGMLTNAYLSTLAGVYLPGKRSLIQSVSMKLRKPVYEGDTLTIEGTVAEKHDVYRLLIIKVEIRNQDNEKVAKGEMMVGVE